MLPVTTQWIDAWFVSIAYASRLASVKHTSFWVGTASERVGYMICMDKLLMSYMWLERIGFATVILPSINFVNPNI